MPRVHLPDGRIVNFPDGMSESDIAKAMDDLAAPTRETAPASSEGPSLLQRIGDAAYQASPIKAAKDAYRLAMAHPIETGAIVGGAVAAPLTGGASLLPAAAAAGLGGAGGAGLGMIANALGGSEDSPTTAAGVLKRMGTEGLTQAATEGGGQLAQGALKAIASQAYRGALRPAASIRAKYPNVVEQGLADAAIVGPRSSAARAVRLMRDSRGAADQMVADVGRARAGGEIPVSEITKGLPALAAEADQLAKAGGTASRAGLVAERAGAIPAPSLEEAHAAARMLNDQAENAFKASRMGGAPVSLDSQIDKALATGYSNAVKERVPGLAEQNALTSTRYGLSKALRAAAERPSVLGNIIAGSTGVGEGIRSGDPTRGLATALAIKSLYSPRALSMGAIGLDRLANAPLANSYRAALLAALNNEAEK